MPAHDIIDNRNERLVDATNPSIPVTGAGVGPVDTRPGKVENLKRISRHPPL